GDFGDCGSRSASRRRTTTEDSKASSALTPATTWTASRGCSARSTSKRRGRPWFNADAVYSLDQLSKAAPAGGRLSSAPPPATAEPAGEATRIESVDDLDQWNVPDRVRAIIVQGHDPDNPKDGDNSRSGWLFDVC